MKNPPVESKFPNEKKAELRQSWIGYYPISSKNS